MADRHVAGARLSAFLDDELPEEEAMTAARHLAACERCLGELDQLRATRDALRRLPSLQAPVLFRAEPSRSTRSRSWVRRLVVAAASVSAPALVGLAIYIAGGDAGSVEPSTELFLVEYVGRTGGGPVPAPVGGQR